jgi:hypothetical protein
MSEQTGGHGRLAIIAPLVANRPVQYWNPLTGRLETSKWRTAFDENRGKWYYWHIQTKKTQWLQPHLTLADVELHSVPHVPRPFVLPRSRHPFPSDAFACLVLDESPVQLIGQGAQVPQLGPLEPVAQAEQPVAKKPRRGKSDEQKAHDKSHQYSVVQVKLNTIRGNEGTWDPVKGLLETTAIIASRVAYEAYLLADLHLRRMLHEGKPLPELNQSFFRSVCSQIMDNPRKIHDDELRASAERYRQFRPVGLERPPIKNMSAVLDSLAREMKTMTQNHIVLNIARFVERYVGHRYHLADRRECREFIWRSFHDPPSHLVDHQKEFLAWMELDLTDEFIVKKNLGHFLTKMLDILNYYDQLPPGAQEGVRRFTLLPKKGSLTPGFILIDRTTLPEILKKMEMGEQNGVLQAMLNSMDELLPGLAQESRSELRGILENRRDRDTKFDQEFQQNKNLALLLWRTLFDMSKFETTNRKLAYMISTNGEAVSVYLQKKKPEDPAPSDEYDELLTARQKFHNGGCDLMIGIDPGRTYAAFGFRGEVDVRDGKQRSLHFPISTKELRHDSKMNERAAWEKRMRQRPENSQYAQAVAALPTLKVGGFETFEENLRQTLAQAPLLLEHHESNRKYRALRFKVSRYTKKALAKAARKVTKKRNPQDGERDCHSPSRTIIGWGDWSQQDGFLRGTPKAPVKKLRRAFKKMGFTIVEVDEYRTSKRCSSCRCHDNVENVSYNGVRAHQVVRCNNSECGLFWQRDCNASRNMHAVLLTMILGQERPEYLKRGAD